MVLHESATPFFFFIFKIVIKNFFIFRKTMDIMKYEIFMKGGITVG
jgi:hypothetical protein